MWVQYGSQRVASESALYIVSALISTRMIADRSKGSLLHLEMWAIIIPGACMAWAQFNEYLILGIVECLCWVAQVPARSQTHRWTFMGVCIVSRWIWYPEVTFYVTMSMMVYLVGLLVVLKSAQT
jgi:hypothetical protein